MPIPNQQWKYVIVETDDGSGEVHGTDDLRAAKEWARTDTVIEVATCCVLTVDDEREEFGAKSIPEQTLFNF